MRFDRIWQMPSKNTFSIKPIKELIDEEKKQIARIVKHGGKVISFGWNSGGIGKKLGFEITRILLVPHGGHHNDTIVTVETKISNGEK